MFERKFPGLQPSAPPPSEPAPSSAAGDTPDSERNFFSASRDESLRDDQVTFRLKSVAGIGFVLLAMYAGIEAIKGGGRPARGGTERMAVARPVEDRSVNRAKARAGFLERLFCKGLQRSSFCPDPNE